MIISEAISLSVCCLRMTHFAVLVRGLHGDEGNPQRLSLQHPAIVVGLIPRRRMEVTSHRHVDDSCGAAGRVAVVMGDDPDL